MELFEGLKIFEIILMVMGILLFLVQLFILVYYVLHNRPLKYVLPSLIFPIVMIGFPGIKTFQIQGISVELKESISAVEQNPDDPQAQQNLARAIDRLEHYPNLRPSTQLILSEAYAQRDNREEAQRYLRTALQRNPRLRQIESERIESVRARIAMPVNHP